MDVDEVPSAGGSRPDRLAPVSGPQERVLRHTVEQAGDVVPGCLLMTPLCRRWRTSRRACRRSSTPSSPRRRSKCPGSQGLPVLLLTAEQLVDVPLPAAGVVQAWVCHANCQVWSRIWDSTGRIYWWRLDSGHVQWNTPPGITASPGRYINTGQG